MESTRKSCWRNADASHAVSNQLLQLGIDLLEVVAAFFAAEPLRRPHRALGETTARERFVADLNLIVSQPRGDRVRARSLTCAMGSNLHLERWIDLQQSLLES